MLHTSVLVPEVCTALALQPGSTIVDATLGSGGHTKAIAQELNGTGSIIACDVDPAAIAEAEGWRSEYVTTISLYQENFANVRTLLERISTVPVQGILADLGWRTDQFVAGGRGFSFQADEPLLMTYGDPATYTVTAATIVNEWDIDDIANVLFGYGEERYARRIAQAIITERASNPIQTAKELAEIIAAAVPARYRAQRIHPATKSFQALRIAVNDELSVLDTFITEAFETLAPDGRLVIISFHSLEDRIVKHRFRSLAATGLAELPHKKPVVASREDCTDNPRARSAKLRTIKKTYYS